MHKKIKDIEWFQSMIKAEGTKVALCHGCFDVLHVGHIRHLTYAKSRADILIVSVTGDQFIDKANYRPCVPQELRAEYLSQLECVDFVVITEAYDAVELMSIIKPNLFVKGLEYQDQHDNRFLQEIKAASDQGCEIIFSPADFVNSSSLIIDKSRPNLALEKLRLLMQSSRLTFDGLKHHLTQFKELSIHIIGDLIIDKHTYCTMAGCSSKEPMLNARAVLSDYFIGGAGIVARHIAASGAKATLTSMIGLDQYGKAAIETLDADGVFISDIKHNTEFSNIKETIFVNKQGKIKIEFSSWDKLTDACISSIEDVLRCSKDNAVIFSDYRFGVLNKGVISRFVSAIDRFSMTVADCHLNHKNGNIIDYIDVNMLTVNENEARHAIGDYDSVIRMVGEELFKRSRCETLMLKCGPMGLIVFRDQESPRMIMLDSFARNVVDPVGSGDAFLAYSTLGKLVGGDAVGAIFGSFAAALECERIGNIPISSEEVLSLINDIEAAS